MKAIKKHKGALITLGIFTFLGLMFVCSITAIGLPCVGDPDECPPGVEDYYGESNVHCCCCSELNWCFAICCCCDPSCYTQIACNCSLDISGYCVCVGHGCQDCE